MTNDPLVTRLPTTTEAERWAIADVALTLSRLLHKMGVTQRELAKRMGVSEPRVSLLLSGQVNSTIRSLTRAADALGLELRISFVPRSTPRGEPDRFDAKAAEAVFDRAEALLARPMTMDPPIVLDAAATVRLDQLLADNTAVSNSVLVLVMAIRLDDAFGERVLMLREGREIDILGQEPLVARLAQAIREDPKGAERVEEFFDELFKDLREGEEFEHMTTVMAVLVALRAAEVPRFPEICAVFANARGPEVGVLRRFAKRLLAQTGESS